MSASQSSDLLFVYGTLRRGSDHANAVRLARESAWLGKATLTGTLYRVSWYPALVLQGTDTVTGDLMRLHDPSASLPWLDAFEGCSPDDHPPHDYRRERIEVMASHGPASALVYVWNLPLNGLERIASGDWLIA
ncbi:gamma-glutamylcyclotransferase family protein [Blastomonas aquatica]|uniref:Gamma-glutamylcyclotransferase n=1 Tax=Blastomonas aquatica TaxID=1510276 RepID=A0ABQ1JJZ4_9SPHN|nr:gamma-glutamylcyclotransferase family protein [Blastomonas aquatica]GGB70924.1 gamma-glutamylcyclotransferase [Blastomonas aquatica]